jgi:hypothetical protein
VNLAFIKNVKIIRFSFNSLNISDYTKKKHPQSQKLDPTLTKSHHTFSFKLSTTRHRRPASAFTRRYNIRKDKKQAKQIQLS